MSHLSSPIILLCQTCFVLLFSSCNETLIMESSCPEENHFSAICVRSAEPERTPTPYDITQRMVALFFSSDKNSLSVTDIQPFIYDGYTCLYIVNFEKGFKIISADTRVPLILAESENKAFILEDLDNNGVKVWLEDTADRISKLKRYNLETGEDYSELWSNFRSHRPVPETRSFPGDSIWIRIVSNAVDTINYNLTVPTMLPTKWGQEAPWNTKMPLDQYNLRSIVGCAAVAVSQVLYYFNQTCNCPHDLYHQIPITNTIPDGNGYVMVNLSRSDYYYYSSRWSDMPLDANSPHADYVSDLMLDIGGRLSMHYSSGGSLVILASDYSIPNLSLCGISSSFGSYSFSNVETSLLNGKPVIVTAFPSSTPSTGHTWVIDGYLNYTLRASSLSTYYCIHPEELCNYQNVSDIYTDDEMLELFPDAYNGMQDAVITGYSPVKKWHMNWGHDGTNDDYYGVLDTSSWSYGSLNFMYYRTIHYNISTSDLQ